MADKKVVTTKANEAKGNGKPAAVTNGPAKQVTDRNSVVELLTTNNPKRGASRGRFAHYKTGMTVGEYIEKAGSKGMADIRWDQEPHAPENKPFIKLHAPGTKLTSGKAVGQ